MNRSKQVMQLLAAAIAVGMIGYGVYRGEVPVVFTKAVNICLECIGLG